MSASLDALIALGLAWRGDWSDFDGRTLRDQLYSWRELHEATPNDAARTYAGNVRSRAARSPERIAAFIEELAGEIEAADRLRAALDEIHECNCGCDEPGNLALCVAKPTTAFVVLSRAENSQKEPT